MTRKLKNLAERAANLAEKHREAVSMALDQYHRETGVDASDDPDSEFMAWIHYGETPKEPKE